MPEPVHTLHTVIPQAEDAEAAVSSSDDEADDSKPATVAAPATTGPAAVKPAAPKTGTAEGGRLVQDEQSATGGVSWAIVKAYIMALGGWPVVVLLFTIFILAEAFRVGSTVWLSFWTGSCVCWGLQGAYVSAGWEGAQENKTDQCGAD